MATTSKIEWTDTTWNPVTGCTRISSGCKNCYAERMARRLQAMGQPRYRNGFRVTLHHDLIHQPFNWKKPRTIFVNSMSDLFHEDIPLEFIQTVFATMERCPQHLFQILTKRSKRLREIHHLLSWPEHVWMGVTVEDGTTVDRLTDLTRVPAYVRFLSCEPLIGPLGKLPLDGIHWIIVGGESGPGARPMCAEWVESVFRQCQKRKIPFFFKQWGGVRKHVTGRLFHGKTYDDLPVSAYRHPARQLAFNPA
jgi:protein gp37